MPRMVQNYSKYHFNIIPYDLARWNLKNNNSHQVDFLFYHIKADCPHFLFELDIVIDLQPYEG